MRYRRRSDLRIAFGLPRSGGPRTARSLPRRMMLSTIRGETRSARATWGIDMRGSVVAIVVIPGDGHNPLDPGGLHEDVHDVEDKIQVHVSIDH